MYKRLIKAPKNKSFFLFGPRGTGKTTWLKKSFSSAVYINLLQAENFNRLLAHPGRLEKYIPKGFSDWVILDEVQRIPELLNEVHRLIEEKRIKFILTGSSARKLRRKKANLLAGRALTYNLYPLTSHELEEDFNIEKYLRFGGLPSVYSENEPKRYLESYVKTYLEEEVKQEGLTRDLAAFGRFLETASFSQASLLNISEVARESSIHRKVAENYFSILDDLLIAYRLRPFTRKAKRKSVSHAKFYFFDVGVYNAIRPRGPLDSPAEAEGALLETFVLQELMALNAYYQLGYSLFYWRTAGGHEVDFILYGEKGLMAIEVKRKANIGSGDLRGLRQFKKDYPEAKAYLLSGGSRTEHENGITIVPVAGFLRDLRSWTRN